MTLRDNRCRGQLARQSFGAAEQTPPLRRSIVSMGGRVSDVHATGSLALAPALSVLSLALRGASDEDANVCSTYAWTTTAARERAARATGRNAVGETLNRLAGADDFLDGLTL